MNNRKAQLLRHLITHADGWVVNNLRYEHNSVFPAELIENDRDIEIGEKLLTSIIGNPVTIRKTESGYICER